MSFICHKMALKRCFLLNPLKVNSFGRLFTKRPEPCLAGCVRFLATQRAPDINGKVIHKDFQLKSATHGDASEEFIRVFKFPHIRYLVAFCRVKVYMTVLSVGASPPMLVLYLFGQFQGLEAYFLAGFIAFSTSTMIGMGELFRRIVGMIFISRDSELVRFAHLSFWGRRHDFVVPIEDIKLISETSEDPRLIVWKVQFHTEDEKPLLITTKFGGIEDPEAFERIFGSLPSNSKST